MQRSKTKHPPSASLATPGGDCTRRRDLQFHKLGPVYVTLKSVNVFHHPSVPAGSRGIDMSRHVAVVAGADFVIGEFEDTDGRPYGIVVNKSLANSYALRMAFKASGTLMMVNACSGGMHAWSGANIWLAPGQGRLLTGRPCHRHQPYPASAWAKPLRPEHDRALQTSNHGQDAPATRGAAALTCPRPAR